MHITGRPLWAPSQRIRQAERTPKGQISGSLWVMGRVGMVGMTQAETSLQTHVPEITLTPLVC